MKTNTPHIVLVGCGKMGTALLQGWQKKLPDARYSVIDPNQPPLEKFDYFQTIDSAADAFKTADVIILAIKPQLMKEVCTALSSLLPSKTLILSIAAGQTLARFSEYFGQAQPVIRCMPNTPASIGKGASAAVANYYVEDHQKSIATILLETAGELSWLNDEALLDAVTAVSGSGPAYVFYLIEALSEAGQKAGLNRELSEALSRQTVIGSAALAEASPHTSAETLRQNVTSPGGTTEAALKILMGGKFQQLMNKAVEAARKRGAELSKANLP